MNCAKCGSDNRDGARFCRRCGVELAEPPVTEAPPVVEAKEAPLEEPLPQTEEVDVAAKEPISENEPEEEPVAEPVPEEEELLPERQEAEAESEVEGEAGAEQEPEVEEIAILDEEQEPVVELEEAEFIVELEGELVGEAEEIIELEVEKIMPEAEQVLPDEQPEIGEGEEVLPPPQWLEEDLDEARTLPGVEDGVFTFWREEGETPEPLPPETVIAGRYLVVEVVDAQAETILYYARDLHRCWQCSFEGNASDDAFCAQCGAALDRRPSVRLLEVGDADAEPGTGELVVARLSHEGRNFLVLAEPEPESPSRPAAQGVRLLVGQRSDVGLVRELDEDSLLTFSLSPTFESRTGSVLGLFSVADGMGGHEGGEVASKIALQVLAERVMLDIILPELGGEHILDEDIAVRLRQAIMVANDEVYLARKKSENDMGTTLTTAFVRDNRLFLAHVGDCRAYRWNADGLEQLTTDHSVVASMVASGQAEPDEIYTHPHRSVIYRCIGDKPTVQVDTDVLPLELGDRLIVCSDGLWEMIRNEGLEDVMMQEADPQAACDLLVRHANVAGGEDNISVIIVRLEAV